jgi:hypothetical protein
VPVHDVDVDEPRAGVEDLAHLLAEPCEVGAEDRWGDGHIGSSIESPQLWQVTVAVDDIRTMVECWPQLGHTERNS